MLTVERSTYGPSVSAHLQASSTVPLNQCSLKCLKKEKEKKVNTEEDKLQLILEAGYRLEIRRGIELNPMDDL